jgi:hypothetical protein
MRQSHVPLTPFSRRYQDIFGAKPHSASPCVRQATAQHIRLRIILPLTVQGYSRVIGEESGLGSIGQSGSGLEFPYKPRGMHWRTYERWREKHEVAVAKSWSGFWVSRFALRLGLG